MLLVQFIPILLLIYMTKVRAFSNHVATLLFYTYNTRFGLMHIKLLSVVKLTQDCETSDAKGFIDISGKAKKNMIA